MVRALVCGWDDVPASADDIVAMQEIVRAAMAEGAVGLSAGLTYTPGMYADNAELLALCATVGELGGFFAPHHRSYGKGALDAYAEMIDLTTRAGCPLHLSHATMNFAPNKGRAGELLAMLDAAIADGADITLDTYPYLPGATTLSAVLPSWSSAGGQDATLARLRDPAALARIRDDLEVHGSDGCHGVVAEWDTIEISGVTHAELDGVVGRTIAQIAADTRARAVRRRSSTCCCATSWAPGSCSTSGTRRTCRRSCATRGTPAAATACWSAPSRTHAPGAPSRATSATTAATWACSRSRSASGTSPGAPPRGCGCATAAWSGPATPRTWCCSTLPRSPTRPPTPTRGSLPSASPTCSSTASSRWTTGSAPPRSPVARCAASPDGAVAMTPTPSLEP